MFRKSQVRNFEQGSCYMILVAISITIYFLFIKQLSGKIFLPLIVFFRCFVPLIVLSPYFFSNIPQIKKIRYRSTGYHFLRAVFVILSQYSIIYYFTKASLTEGVLLFNTAPMFIPILTYLFFRDRISAVVWVSIIISFIGVICILQPAEDEFSIFSIFGFISGLTLALSQILYGLNTKKETLSQNLFLFFLYSSVISFIIFVVCTFISSDIYKLLITQTQSLLNNILLLAAIAIITSAIQFFLGKAFKRCTPSVLAPYLYLSVVFSSIIDAFFGNHQLTNIVFIIGIILVFTGSLIRVFYRSRGLGSFPKDIIDYSAWRDKREFI